MITDKQKKQIHKIHCCAQYLVEALGEFKEDVFTNNAKFWLRKQVQYMTLTVKADLRIRILIQHCKDLMEQTDEH